MAGRNAQEVFIPQGNNKTGCIVGRLSCIDALQAGLLNALTRSHGWKAAGSLNGVVVDRRALPYSRLSFSLWDGEEKNAKPRLAEVTSALQR